MGDIQKKRLEKRILILLSELYYRELKDQDLGFCTFVSVELNKDKSVAKVSVSLMGDDIEKRKTLHALKRASGFIRSKIGKAIRMRYAPRVDFIVDESASRIEQIENILRKESQDSPTSDK